MGTVSRFAPSPTGYLHIGGLRTAIFAWLFAKANKGKVLLRFEDTDQERSKEEFTKSIMESFSWMDIDFDEKPYLQSKAKERHIEVAENLSKNERTFCHIPYRLPAFSMEKKHGGGLGAQRL